MIFHLWPEGLSAKTWDLLAYDQIVLLFVIVWCCVMSRPKSFLPQQIVGRTKKVRAAAARYCVRRLVRTQLIVSTVVHDSFRSGAVGGVALPLSVRMVALKPLRALTRNSFIYVVDAKLVISS